MDTESSPAAKKGKNKNKASAKKVCARARADPHLSHHPSSQPSMDPRKQGEGATPLVHIHAYVEKKRTGNPPHRTYD